ncbi:hypothetical protein [Streptomyces chryseus]|uniref:Integral membrane protein n=1 Tax=Streptomyces chryseus TaxID=68186 RepID=A0ABQ3DSA6_9ACTN|nr:hypothetical protein [Streptomyces chryseus]GGX32131.1 hypothetical protein GCM10010353_53970 [Streptomyces chryseus]GHB14155.1 hypothetical protein GCM10010346_42100 [Streptomyces chryseus]
MIRNVLGWILALVGATAAVLSPFRTWYDGRLGRDYRIGDLFGGITDSGAAIMGSLLLPFAFAALLTLAGLLLRSRAAVALAGVVVLGFTMLWMVRVGQAQDGLTVDTDGTGLDVGVALALGGGVLLLLAAVLLPGRARRRRRVDGDHHHPYEPAQREGPDQPYPWSPGQGGPEGPDGRGGPYGDGRDDPHGNGRGGPYGPDDRPPPEDHRYR